MEITLFDVIPVASAVAAIWFSINRIAATRRENEKRHVENQSKLAVWRNDVERDIKEVRKNIDDNRGVCVKEYEHLDKRDTRIFEALDEMKNSISSTNSNVAVIKADLAVVKRYVENAEKH